MTLTFKLDLDDFELKQHTKYPGQWLFSWQITVRTHSCTHQTSCSVWTTKVVDIVLSSFLHPIIHKIGHFGDILPSQSLCLVLKTKSNTTKANIYLKKMTQNKHIKLKPGSV